MRRGWTTGACATAAVRAGLCALWGGAQLDEVQITLPKGERPVFKIAHREVTADWVEIGITKDAGDDPDVTHGALIIARVARSLGGVRFHAGDGVGTITKAGLPIAVGEPAINPVPRQMMQAEVEELAVHYGQAPDIDITIRIPGGRALALKTWNPRLGIVDGLSVLGTTGIVRPFSCAAWIASIHRGIDVARACGAPHVAGCTGATSERAVQALHGLPDTSMLDMGDFAGGLMKYLRRHPVARLTIGGGIGKMTKLAQGARDLHSARSQVDFTALAQVLDQPGLAKANTALEAYTLAGPDMAQWVAHSALANCQSILQSADITVDCVVIDRTGRILAQS
ncbi:cobalamin (vitamin B12) biosynthesis CbiDprotein CbiD [Planktomarina temperata RCA23]|uniref:Cobalt-precorrin-5B C(1)-methyltransferase n=2 Tax=Planktomarina TaxID=1284657 RepID=A0AAN0RJC8_9RHOB|nr:cobalamin (vitamin B12) biosynthesis CbiDprotein CbiD [Planktomarina temperata RCA23]